VEDKKQQVESSSARAKVWTSLIGTTLGVVASLASALVSTADLLRLPMAIVAAVGAVLVSAAFTFVLVRRERGPSRVAKLKNELATAYLSALDGSTFNPHAKESR
jgi:hypothetical protein